MGNVYFFIHYIHIYTLITIQYKMLRKLYIASTNRYKCCKDTLKRQNLQITSHDHRIFEFDEVVYPLKSIRVNINQIIARNKILYKDEEYI